jgi:mannosyltransferase
VKEEHRGREADAFRDFARANSGLAPGTSSRTERSSRVVLYVSVLTAVGAAVRFTTLDRQSFWLDELVTVSLVRRDFGDMLATIPGTEATPYLYYVLAWPWTRLFGFGEFGLRSLSALAGTAVIPVAYAAGATLVARRAGLIAAALVSVSPFLVWYSQEARSYSLFVLLAACSVLCFGKTIRSGGPYAPMGWALASSLAIMSHYFAIFIVLPEAAWLLARLRPRRSVALASLLPAAVLLLHAPLILRQRDPGDAVTEARLLLRIVGIPKNLVVGYSFPWEILGSVAAAALVVIGVVLVVLRTSAEDRRGAFLAGGLAVFSASVPVVLALGGVDFLSVRNLIAAVVPGLICVAAGYSANRLGILAAAALCALSLGISLAVPLDPRYGRTDWRGAAEGLGAPAVERVIVITPFMSRTLWDPYLPGLSEPAAETTQVREIIVLGLASEYGFSAGPVRPPDGPAPAPPSGFRLVGFERRPTYTLARYRARTPRAVTIDALTGLRLSMQQQAGVLVQAPGASGDAGLDGDVKRIRPCLRQVCGHPRPLASSG